MDQPKQAPNPKDPRVVDVGRRQKLKDITSKVNNHFPASPRKLQRRDISPQKLPHHASLQPGGDLQYLTTKHGTQPLTIENKRLSAVTDSQRSSKRYSQSSASTNASVEFTGRKRKSRVGPWLLGSTLGQGATCRVRKAKHTATGLPAAIKIVSRNVAKDQRSESVVVMDNMLAADSRWQVERRIPFNIEREVLIMKLIQHPNVIRLYDVWENRGEM
jgi:serine/threonine-protein kinase HSL1 (negative regulator of Swe1 kinase)